MDLLKWLALGRREGRKRLRAEAVRAWGGDAHRARRTLRAIDRAIRPARIFSILHEPNVDATFLAIHEPGARHAVPVTGLERVMNRLPRHFAALVEARLDQHRRNPA